ncbi:MAG: hypothetical protein LBF08_00225 [Dysgonamonadaceae bacterium]|nr:hypothetical protein [Dysgonamonadaceae bacterium]
MKTRNGSITHLFLLSLASLFCVACQDDYYYNDREPDKATVGQNIYDRLNEDGRFTYYLRLVESVQDAGVDYTEVLKTTGTKTVFVATDSAFDAFFADNPYGIRKFEDFTAAQKRALFFTSMLNDAYLLEMMSNSPGSGASRPNPGQAMRTATAWSVLDSVPFEKGDRLPDNPYWEQYRERGIYILKDNSTWTMVHFLPPHMRMQNISAEDFRILTKTKENPQGITWDGTSPYIFDTKITEWDITCKNGYINVLEKVLFPVGNMAEYLRDNPDTRAFSRLMHRFCAPYLDAGATNAYRQLHPGFSEQIFTMRFFTDNNAYAPDTLGRPDMSRRVAATLKFDPGKNDYSPSNAESDMGAIFVPTDKALREYFADGAGKFLKERYTTLDSIPDNVINLLLNSHMHASFLQTTPERFTALTNSMGASLNVKKEDVVYSSVCSNGVVYVVNRVYPPSDYASVRGPVLINEATQIMNRSVDELNFNLYLLSLENRFSFIVPTDAEFDNYINPASVGASTPERWRFYLKNNQVNATRYSLATGDSTGIVSTAQIRNALTDIIDNHIIVGDIEDGKTYYETKGGATVKILRSGGSLQLDGGGNGERNETANVRNIYSQENGKTYLTDKIVQTPTASVYSVLEKEEKFSAFFELCRDVYPVELNKKTYGGSVFVNDNGITLNVAFFNTFNYTVYVPTNEAMRQAHDAGRYKTPEEIDGLDVEQQAAEMQKLYEFLRFHFQDNSVYIGGRAYNNEWFETATLDETGKKFRRLWVTNTPDALSIGTEKTGGKKANVITSNGLYNMMTRDYKFTSGAIVTNNSQIVTSSYAVVHQIDGVLDFK